MKLRRLAVEGFMPFRTRQEIDFSSVDIFALLGPTGSGKSALLDAVCFALFARAPRWQNDPPTNKLVSQGAKTLKVELDFDVGLARYRVARIVTQRKKSQALHEAEVRRWTADEWRPLSNERLTSKMVTAAIEDLVGMGYDTFTRTILLPQGQFDRLLKPKEPKERKALLIELAGLSVYDRMAELASKKKAEVECRLRELEASVEGCGNATPELRDELREHFGKCVEARQTQTEAVQVQRNTHAAEKALLELCHRCEKLRSTVAALETELDTRELERSRLKRARDLLSHKGTLERFERALERASLQEMRFQQATAALDTAREALREVEARWESATSDAESLSAHEERRDSLRALRHDAKAWSEKAEELERLQKARKKQADEQERLGTEIDQLKRQTIHLQEKVEISEANLQSGEVDTSRETELALADDQSSRLAALLVDERKCEEELRDAGKALTLDQTAMAKTERHVLAGETALATAKGVYGDRQRALRLHHAHLLRSDLAVGQSCPVCESLVRALPQVSSNPDVVQAQSQLEQAEYDLEASSQALDRARSAHSRCLVEQRSAEDKSKASEERLETLRATSRDLGQELQLRMQWKRLPRDPLKEIQKQRRDLEEKRLHQERERRQLALWREELYRATGGLAGKKAHLESAVSTLKVQAKQVKALSQRVDELRRELEAKLEVTSGFDQVVEDRLSELDAAIKRLSLELKAASEAREGAVKRESGASSTLIEREEAAKQSRLELAIQQAELDQILEKLELSTFEELRDGIVPENQLRVAEAHLADYDLRLNIEKTRCVEIENELGDRHTDRPTVDGLAGILAQAEGSLKELILEEGRLKAEIEAMERNLERIQDIRAEIEQVKSRLRTFEKLSRMLDAKGLKAFVSQKLMDQILIMASAKLEQLSGRYGLQMNGDDIYVTDAWNAGAERDVRSLSGGETFLASLSLALALVDYLSEGTPLESLFIDEGFGTLDSDTLEMVAQTLETLHQQGRLIGVVTHVSELAERLPTQIRIKKEQGGSLIIV